jgi:hypothetical protein
MGANPMAFHMSYVHPDQIEAAKRKEKRDRENQLNLRRIASGAGSAGANSARIAPYGLNRPHEVLDFPYLAHSGPSDKNPKEKYISLVTGDRVPEKHEKDYISHRKHAESCMKLFALCGTAPIHFDLYAIDIDESGVNEWRGRGAFTASLVWDMDRFADRFGRIGAMLAERGLFIRCDEERDCNLVSDDSGKVTGFRGSVMDYAASDSDSPGRLACGSPITIQWQQQSFDQWIMKAVVLHDGDVLPIGKGARHAERIERYSKLLAMDYQPHAFAVYRNDAQDKGGTSFFAIGEDKLWHSYGRSKGNAFTGEDDGYRREGFGELPGRLTAEQLAFIDCRLAASGLEFLLIPTEGEEIDSKALSVMWGCEVSIPGECDFG